MNLMNIDASLALPRLQAAATQRLRVQALSPGAENELQSIKEYLELFINQRRTMAVADGIANIHILGALSSALPPIEKLLDSTDYADICAEIEAAENDDSVRGVFLDINSPGGSVLGCAECGDAIARLAAKKPVLAYTDELMCSAAYKVGCNATAVWASKSAILGSIGVIMTPVSYQKMLADAGIRVEQITPAATDLKGTGSPYLDLTEAQRAHLQEVVEMHNDEFRAVVLGARGSVPEEAMRGQGIQAIQALGYNLVDALGSRKDAMNELLAMVN